MQLWKLANLFSFANALFGILAIFFSAAGFYVLAARLIILGILCDVLDGPIARRREPTKEGELLDRLSDLITQNFAAAVLLLVITNFHPLSFVAGGLLAFTGFTRIFRNYIFRQEIIGLPLWPATILIVTGTFLEVPFWVLILPVFITVLLGLIPIPYFIFRPWLSQKLIIALRKPAISWPNKKELSFVGLRIALFLFLLVASLPGLVILNWFIFGGIILFIVVSAFYSLIFWISSWFKQRG